jgi:hypothetical protein
MKRRYGYPTILTIKSKVIHVRPKDFNGKSFRVAFLKIGNNSESDCILDKVLSGRVLDSTVVI